MYIINAIKYISRVVLHKVFVGYFCFKAGLYWRGIIHDLSKFSWIELSESIKYYDPNKSPITISRELNGYSKAWQHHKGRNTHHYVYWVDDIDQGGKLIRMPFEDALEMVCDGLGACIAYNRNFKDLYDKELDWWNKIGSNQNMHPHSRAFLGRMIRIMSNEQSCDVLRKKRALSIYDNILVIYSNIPQCYPMKNNIED